MHKGFIKTAAIIGALSVALGAFGAHALKQLAQENVISIFETGVRYQFYHVFALLFTGLLYKEFPRKPLKMAGIFFMAGIVLFSGSLYLLTYLAIAKVNSLTFMGAITPLGGLAFIVGWLCLLYGVAEKR